MAASAAFGFELSKVKVQGLLAAIFTIAGCIIAVKEPWPSIHTTLSLH
jgi:hypothetical protein